MEYIEHPSVRIMMATYNGDKYLKEQIDSIIKQTYSNWSMIIQDDGSNDNTWTILEDYAKDDCRISIKKSQEENHGAYYNFHSLANQEKQRCTMYDYYMFCDQDDVWDRDKIARMVSFVSIKEQGTPLFCFADMSIIDGTGKIIIPSICSQQHIKYINNISLFFSHIIYGCNTIMNRSAFYSVPILDITEESVGILSHYNLYAKYVGIVGEVLYFAETTMGYRRHGGNVTKKHQYRTSIKRLISRVFRMKDLAKDHALTYNQSLIAIKLLKKQYSIISLDEIENSIRSGGVEAFVFCKRNHVSWGSLIKNISRSIVILSKEYLQFLRY